MKRETGRLLKQEAWAECIRPALADRQGWAVFLTTPCGTNWLYDLWLSAETAPGWARWQRPTSDNRKIPAGELDEAKRELGTYAFSQEFEAAFLTPGGGFFKAEWLTIVYRREGTLFVLEDAEATKVDPTDLLVFTTVDLAASVRTTADYSVVMTFGKLGKKLLLLDVDRARREGPALVPAMKRAVDKWSSKTVWIEKVGFQLSIIQEARQAGLPVRELVPDRDKVARALPATARLEAGDVFLPREAPWLADFKAELLAFPNGPHDDQVDAFSYGVEAAKSVHRPFVGFPEFHETDAERERREIFEHYAPKGDLRDLLGVTRAADIYR